MRRLGRLLAERLQLRRQRGLLALAQPAVRVAGMARPLGATTLSRTNESRLTDSFVECLNPDTYFVPVSKCAITTMLLKSYAGGPGARRQPLAGSLLALVLDEAHGPSYQRLESCSQSGCRRPCDGNARDLPQTPAHTGAG